METILSIKKDQWLKVSKLLLYYLNINKRHSKTKDKSQLGYMLNVKFFLTTGVCPLLCRWDPIMQVHLEFLYFLLYAMYGLFEDTSIKFYIFFVILNHKNTKYAKNEKFTQDWKKSCQILGTKICCLFFSCTHNFLHRNTRELKKILQLKKFIKIWLGYLWISSLK